MVEISQKFLEIKGRPFEDYGLGTLENVLAGMSEVEYVEGHGYYLPLDDELHESPYWNGQREEEERVLEEDDEDEEIFIDVEDEEDIFIDVDDDLTDASDSGWEDDLGWDGTPNDMCPDHPGGCYCNSDCEF
ncbi:hypothetical protein ABEB36_015049 [Hypothenemus hampei]|uniref:Uncharacterized protein n=1 Tax=Hypothenemus hampei TaxID=57062 RepID=A0ABD1E1N6_HYPHA